MADILHNISIKAPPPTVFAALTTCNGVQQWWTDQCDMANREGERCHFWFDDGHTCFTMEARKLLANQRVFWQCSEGPSEWLNTDLWWEITPQDRDWTLLDLKHMNWQSDEGMFPVCNTTWGALMHRLKQYCETGCGEPLFRNY